MDEEQVKQIQHTDILYYVEYNGYDIYPWFGVFNYYNVFWKTVHINLLEAAEHRFISSKYIKPTHIDDFSTENVWHPLPKGWTYNTKLFTIEDRTPKCDRKRLAELRIDNPDDIKTALAEGIMVLAKTKYHGAVESEVDRHKGWRIKKYYPTWTLTHDQLDPDYRTVAVSDVFFTYQEALDRCKEIKAERQSEAEMSDEEWSKKEIEKVLKMFPESVSKQYRQILFSMPNIDDLEVKKSSHGLLYRYFSEHGAWKLLPEPHEGDSE